MYIEVCGMYALIFYIPVSHSAWRDNKKNQSVKVSFGSLFRVNGVRFGLSYVGRRNYGLVRCSDFGHHLQE